MFKNLLGFVFASIILFSSINFVLAEEIVSNDNNVVLKADNIVSGSALKADQSNKDMEESSYICETAQDNVLEQGAEIIEKDNNYGIALARNSTLADRLVQVAAGEIGNREGSGGYSKYGNWYGLPYDHWCHMFVSWCANEAGLNDYIPHASSCDVGKNWFIEHSTALYEISNAYGGTYTPQRGDIIYFSGGHTQADSTHVGIVESVESGRVTVIEGNSRNSAGIDVVQRCRYSLSNAYIIGYGVPVYQLDNHAPIGSFEGLSAGIGYINVGGWTFDKDDPSKSIDVHVYIGGPAGVGEGHRIIANISRPDVNAAFGCSGNHGFESRIQTSKTGNQSVYVYAINIGSGDNALIDVKNINIPANNDPIGSFDGVEAGYGYIHVTGWVFDPDEKSKNVAIHIYIGGGAGQSNAEGHQVDINGKTIYANTTRTDVNNVYGCGNNHGFDVKIPTNKTGNQSVYIYAINTIEGNNPCIGSKTVNVPKDTVKPVISNVTVTNNFDGYTVSCKVTDNYGVDRVQFPTWTTNNGQDDLLKDWSTSIKASGTKNGDTYTFTVKASDHKNETGVYKTHIYAYDKGGNETCYEINTINYYKYTISYNANGGSGAPAAQTKVTNVNLTLSTSKPTRANYTFQGWATSPSSTSAKYVAGATYTDNANATLYAVWKPYKHTVTYNANGGSGVPPAQTKTYGEKMYISTVKPVRTGYTFQGWATSATGVVKYNPGDNYTPDQNGGTVTLYAVWKINTYTIKYNANGGNNVPNSQTKEYGKEIKLSDIIPDRVGYKFLYWLVISDEKSLTYYPGDVFSENTDTELTAIWYKPGDVNNDDKVDETDSTLVLKHVTGIAPLDSEKYKIEAADCDEDGVITIADAIWILRNKS